MVRRNHDSLTSAQEKWIKCKLKMEVSPRQANIATSNTFDGNVIGNF